MPSIWFGYRHAFSRIELVGELSLARGFQIDEAYGARLHVDYAFDLRNVRIGAGLGVSANLHHQRDPDPATQLYLAAGVLAFVDIKLSGRVGFRVEGGPVLNLVKQRTAEGTQLALPAAFWVAGGPTWGF